MASQAQGSHILVLSCPLLSFPVLSSPFLSYPSYVVANTTVSEEAENAAFNYIFPPG